MKTFLIYLALSIPVILFCYFIYGIYFKKQQKIITKEIPIEKPREEHNHYSEKIQVHNNRKRTRGRHIQYVSLPNNKTKLINHS